MKTEIQHAPLTSMPETTLAKFSGIITVIFLLAIAIWFARRLGFRPRSRSLRRNELKISASLQLGQRERLVMVDTPQERLLLGVTAHTITLLQTLPALQEEDMSPSSAQQANFQQILHNLLPKRRDNENGR